jgi:ELWxxDGT repeat protein
VLITNTPYIPLNLDALGSLLLFNGGSDLSLWKSDGTAAGTTMLSTVRGGTSSNQSPNGAVLGGTYYYPAGSALWKTDGTVSGTVQIKSFTSGPFGVTLFRGKLYFDASEGQSGLELWTSDGTPDGTVLFADLAANTGNDSTSGSQPDSFTVSGDNMLYFTADDHVHGRELWTTDGTPAGTRLVRDVMPGAGKSDPSGLAATGDALFFVANDGTHGRELWRYAPLAVRATRFDPDTHTLTLTFSENVASPPSIGDLSVRNLANGGSVSATSVAYNAAAHTVTFTLPVLGDGDYRAVLAAGAVRDRDGSALSADVVTPFFQMEGDANHDHVVDFLDLALLAQNYNRANKTFSQGDFNYDNTVDFSDLAILAQHYLSGGTATASETIAAFLSSSSNDTSKPTKTSTKTPTRTPPHPSVPVFRVAAPTPRPRAIPPKKRR